MVALVQEMIALNDRIASGKDEEAKKKTERRIAAVDDRIDRLVQALYGLTEEEIAVVQSLP
jgi:hypothetical protein